MNALLALLGSWMELAVDGFFWTIQAAGTAGIFAGAILLADLASRRWLTAGQKNLLWGLVLIRLVMPLAPASTLSFENIPLPDLSDSTANEPEGWLPDVADEPAASPGGGYAASKPAETAEPATTIDWVGVLQVAAFFCWLGGIVWVLARTAVVNFRFARRVRRLPLADDQRLVELWKSCCGQVGLRRTLPIVRCDEVRQPAVMGVLRPKLLLPSHASELADDQLRMIMLHELAHVRRHDVAFNWVLVLVRALHWWNPVYWLAAARFANLREQACDARVIRQTAGEPARVYSELLLTLAERELAGRGWRVTLPSILGFLSSFFRRRAIRGRLLALRFAGAKPGPGHAVLAGVAIALLAICGLTDAMPPVEVDDALDWVPTITMNSPAAPPDDGPLVTRDYDLTDVLARIAADGALTPDAGPELKWLIEEVLQISRPGKNPDGSSLARSEATYTLEGAELTVHAPESLQSKLAEHLQVWQQSGFGQIAVGCQFYQADRDVASAAGLSWRLEEPSSADNAPTLAANLPAAGPSGAALAPRAAASVVEHFPVMVATLGKKQVAAFQRAFYQQKRAHQFQALKVTTFNGQRATIGDVRLTPFVVGLQKTPTGWQEPLIKVVEDGTTITFRAVHSSDRRQISLNGRLGINKLGDVYDVRAMCNGMPAVVQAPSAKRWRIDFDSTVAEGESVLIGFVPTYDQQLIVYALLSVETVVPQAVAAN